MKITLKRTPEQVELIKAMASRNRNVAYEAQVALAEFIGPVLAEVINNAPTVSSLFQSLQFDADDNPSIPLDLYYDIADEDYVKVWSQSHAGGLPSSQVLPTVSELKVATYTLDSAVDFDRRYAAKSRMDVVSKTFTRVAQEILLKQDRTSATLVMSSLAGATIKSSPLAGDLQVFRTVTADTVLIDDFNKLMTLAKRVNTSWVGGTPATRTRGITDIVCSPEVVGSIRAMAYNPVNTAAAPVGGTPADGQMAPEQLRQELFSAAGLPSFYGINVMEVNEMGVGQRFNKLFGAIVASEGATVIGGGGTGTWVTGDDEIVIGIDRSKDSLIRPVVVGEGSPSELQVLVDDQFSVRQNKIGYYGKVEEGRICIDNTALIGLCV